MKATNDITEKRLFPRVKSQLKVTADTVPQNRLTLQDFSEGGLCFDSTGSISSASLSLRLSFANKKLNLTADTEFVWVQPLTDGGFRYGVKFVDVKLKTRTVLRTESIKSHIESLLNDIPNKETQNDVSHFFLEDLAEYMEKVTVFVSQVSKQNGHSRKLQNDLERLNTTILLKGYSLGLLLSDISIMVRVKEIFRSLTGTWAYKSIVMKKALEKTRAYPGDFRKLEMIYKNRPLSEGVGEYFDRYFLNNPDAVAIRSRKGRLREMLHKFIMSKAHRDSISILNVKCGSCREIKELIGEIEHENHIKLTCMDWDKEALDFSQAQLGNIPANIEVDLLNENLLDAVHNGGGAQILGEYDLIYSICLTDFLPDDLLAQCLRFYNRLLPVGGQIILTHKNQEKTFPPITAEWFCDWESIPRSKNDLTNLLNKTLPGYILDVTTDDFGYIHYFTLRKKEDRSAEIGKATGNQDTRRTMFKPKNIF